ncbi:hypothetical protein [Cerina litoralis]
MGYSILAMIIEKVEQTDWLRSNLKASNF